MLKGRKDPTGAKPGLVRFCLAVEGGGRWEVGMKARKQCRRWFPTVRRSGWNAAEWETASHIVWPQGGGDVSPAAPAVVN